MCSSYEILAVFEGGRILSFCFVNLHVLASQKLNLEEKLDICNKLTEALAKKDIRTILIIYKKYK